MSIVSWLTALVGLVTPAFPQGLTLVGTLDNKHGETSPGSGVYYSAMWGYVGPGGREYALLTTATGTAIIEITDTADIHEIVHIPGPQSLWREVRTYKQRAYVVTEAGGGTQIIDLSQLPDTATLVKSFTYTSGIRNTARTHSIEIFDGYLYLNGCANWGATAARGAVIFSLEDPDNPAFVGEYSPNYFHDSYVRNDTIYGASIYNTGGIYVADISNKAAPVELGKISYTGSGTHNVWMTKGGRYLISTDEIGATAKNLKVWDMAASPYDTLPPWETYTVSPGDIGHNVYVRGDYAYAAWYTAGIAVVDATDPLNLSTAGHYDTSTMPPGYDGVWAVYPYYWSGKVVAGDMQNGLFVFTFDSLFARTPTTLIEPADSAEIGTAAPLTFTWTSVADQERDPHEYVVVIEGDSYDTSFSAGTDTSVVFNSVAAMGGGEFKWFVLTEDEANSVSSPDTFNIFKPLLYVDTPNGGEALKIGSTAGIDWTADCDSVQVSYSTDGGGSWTELASVPSVPGHYDWMVPDEPTLDGIVRITNFADSSVLDVSDAPFTVYAATVEVFDGWNIVSVPSDVLDNSIEANFPSSEASVYAYSNGYFVVDSVYPGYGYWSKEPAADTFYSVGYFLASDTIPVVAGWNLFGSVSGIVPVPDIEENGMAVTSGYFGYGPSGYFTATDIWPGYAYWVKVDGEGTLVLNASPAVSPRAVRQDLGGGRSPAGQDENGNRLVFTNASGATRTIGIALDGRIPEELPPPPPDGFDVRYGTGRTIIVRGGGEDLTVTAESSHLTGYRLVEVLPVTSADLPGGATGRIIELGQGTASLTDGEYRLERSSTSATPSSFALGQNYPNPFNPATVISYDLPKEARVTLTVFNMLGEKIGMPVDGAIQAAGSHSVEFDASALPSGVYFYKLTAGSFSETRKMLLAR